MCAGVKVWRPPDENLDSAFFRYFSFGEFNSVGSCGNEADLFDFIEGS